jgi:hypothetical protein
MPGYATVALPSKDNGISPLDKRLISAIKKHPTRKPEKS